MQRASSSGSTDAPIGQIPLTTLLALFAARVAEKPDANAVLSREGNTVRSWTWSELAADVAAMRAALGRMDLARGEHVAIVAPNRYGWILADLATQAAGLVNVPLHATLTGPQLAEQILHSEAKLIFFAGQQVSSQLASIESGLPGELQFASLDHDAGSLGGRHVVSMPAAMADVDADNALRELHAAIRQVSPEDLATIIYTAGTLGQPRGAMFTQAALAGNALACVAEFGGRMATRKLSFLPFSHSLARTCDLYTWLVDGCELALSESRETLLEDLQTLQPTFLVGVPYFFERVRRGLTQAGKHKETGALRRALGGNIRMACCGGAALPPELFAYYQQHEVPVLPGYGLTEAGPVVALSTDSNARSDTVGPPIAGVEIRMADDGEILVQSPYLMQGYWRNPPATDEVLRDGWLHTGDMGEFAHQDGLDQFAAPDEQPLEAAPPRTVHRAAILGHLRVTGRKREMIVTSGGKNIFPAEIESLLMSDSLIAQAIVLGEGQKHLAALIVPEPTTLRAEIRRLRLWVFSRRGALRHRRVRELYRQRIDACLADVASHQQVRTFKLLDRGFTIESGELTPKLSLRREMIQSNLAPEIASLFAN